jgi:hypothetical protein
MDSRPLTPAIRISVTSLVVALAPAPKTPGLFFDRPRSYGVGRIALISAQHSFAVNVPSMLPPLLLAFSRARSKCNERMYRM